MPSGGVVESDDNPEVLARQREQAVVGRAGGDLACLFGLCQAVQEVGLLPCHPRRSDVEADCDFVSAVHLDVGRSDQPRPAFGQVVTRLPEAPQRCRHPDPGEVIAFEVGERATQIVELRIEQIEPSELIEPGQLWLGVPDKLLKPIGVALSETWGVGCRVEHLARVFADGFEHPVAHV